MNPPSTMNETAFSTDTMFAPTPAPTVSSARGFRPGQPSTNRNRNRNNSDTDFFEVSPTARIIFLGLSMICCCIMAGISSRQAVRRSDAEHQATLEAAQRSRKKSKAQLEARRQFVRDHLPVEVYDGNNDDENEHEKRISTENDNNIMPQSSSAAAVQTATTTILATLGLSESNAVGADKDMEHGTVDAPHHQSSKRSSMRSTASSSMHPLEDIPLDEESGFFDGRPGCSICLAPFRNGESVCHSNNPACTHRYHTDCMQDWLLKHEDCPFCRQTYLLNYDDEPDTA